MNTYRRPRGLFAPCVRAAVVVALLSWTLGATAVARAETTERDDVAPPCSDCDRGGAEPDGDDSKEDATTGREVAGKDAAEPAPEDRAPPEADAPTPHDAAANPAPEPPSVAPTEAPEPHDPALAGAPDPHEDLSAGESASRETEPTPLKSTDLPAPRERRGAKVAPLDPAPKTETSGMPAVLPVTAIGAISVGHPHAGYLFNAVQLPKDPRWERTVPELSWTTEETIRDLDRALRRVHEQFPHSPPVMIGAISARNGGPLPPHKSHRTGRDADVYLFRTGGKWYKAATAEDLDRPRTWALLRAFATEADVDMILLDKKLQALLESYALSIGEDPAWVHDLFHGSGRYPNPLVKHVPGHVAHMHVRFASPIARERGRLAYDQLVELGHITLPGREIKHRVEPGDTLGEIAARYKTTVDHIIRQNRLENTNIHVGEHLVIGERQDVRDARAPVVVPPRRLPPYSPRPGARDFAHARWQPRAGARAVVAETHRPGQGVGAKQLTVEPRRPVRSVGTLVEKAKRSAPRATKRGGKRRTSRATSYRSST